MQYQTLYYSQLELQPDSWGRCKNLRTARGLNRDSIHPAPKMLQSILAGLAFYFLIISKTHQHNVVEKLAFRTSDVETDSRLKGGLCRFLSLLLLTGRLYWRCHARFPQRALGDV